MTPVRLYRFRRGMSVTFVLSCGWLMIEARSWVRGAVFLEQLTEIGFRCFHKEYECVDESSRERTSSMVSSRREFAG